MPNATYELFARRKLSGAVPQQSLPVVIDIFNQESIGKHGPADEHQLRELYELSRELNQDLYENFTSSESADEAVFSLAQQRIAQNADAVRALFTAYASAVQAQDQTLIASADAAITQYRASVVSDALADETERFVADDLDEALLAQLNELKDKVTQFETVRRDRTESDSAVDTDDDGIADVDELVLYGTDPGHADTDQDGFTDGAEIISGFNPTDSTAQVPIVYQLPHDTLATAYTNKLLVADVIPDVVLATASSSQEIHTIVRGRALADSFVTLYMHSTTTIAVVRADANGTFTHTFTDELSDGTHTAYAALTNNAGQIIAQSPAYVFIKSGTTVTPVRDGASDPQPVVTDAITTDKTTTHIVIGLSVLLLGALLLLLGVGLRTQRPDIIVQTQ